jgi:hypothetical protein
VFRVGTESRRAVHLVSVASSEAKMRAETFAGTAPKRTASSSVLLDFGPYCLKLRIVLGARTHSIDAHSPARDPVGDVGVAPEPNWPRGTLAGHRRARLRTITRGPAGELAVGLIVARFPAVLRGKDTGSLARYSGVQTAAASRANLCSRPASTQQGNGREPHGAFPT